MCVLTIEPLYSNKFGILTDVKWKILLQSHFLLIFFLVIEFFTNKTHYLGGLKIWPSNFFFDVIDTHRSHFVVKELNLFKLSSNSGKFFEIS